MPYASKEKLPAAVKALPDKAQSIFMAAFNSAFKQYDGDEEKAHAVAWAEVKKQFKKEGDNWVAKDSIPHVTFAEEFMDGADFRINSDGFLVAQPRIARTGIQLYLGRECGRPDMPKVRVYRPQDEVFAPETVRSYTHRPVTDDHPPEMVTPKNWQKYARGHTADEVMRDGGHVRVPMMVCDGGLIDAIHAGKKQLSAGYKSELIWVPEGTMTLDEQEYDAIQAGIRVNHVAVVKAARGGPMLSIGDSFASFADKSTSGWSGQSSRKGRSMKTLMCDGISVELEDRDADIVKRHITNLETSTATLKDQATKDAAALTNVQKQLDTLKGEKAVLEQQVKDSALTPEKIDAAVAERAEISIKAKSILGDGFTTAGKSNMDIKRAVLSKVLGDSAANLKSEDAVNGAFMAATKDAKTGTGGGRDHLAVALSGQRQPGFIGDMDAARREAEKAYNDRNYDLEHAHENGGTGPRPRAQQ